VTVRRALKELHVSNPMVRVENGEEALAYLPPNPGGSFGPDKRRWRRLA